MIYTSYFGNLKNVKNPISIAGKSPYYYKGFEFKILAPKYFWWKRWHDEKLSNEWYIKQYIKTVLRPLDPNKIIQGLFDLYPGEQEVTLLCYELPGQFCHRNIIKYWLQSIVNIKEL